MNDSHDLEPNYGTAKKNLSVYFVGFVLCIALTLLPFWLVERHVAEAASSTGLSLTHSYLLIVLFICAIAQFLVQVVCFLRLSASTDQGRTNIMCFIFSIVVVVVVIGGSAWIMYHLNYNMMH